MILLAGLFQNLLKSETSLLRLKDVGMPMAADRDEVKMAFIVTACKAFRHGRSVREPESWLKRQPTLRFAKDGPPDSYRFLVDRAGLLRGEFFLFAFHAHEFELALLGFDLGGD